MIPISYDSLYDYFNSILSKLGIDSDYTMKSIRKRAATLEYMKSMREHYIKHGGKAL